MQKVEITVPSPVAMYQEGSGVAVPVVLRWTLLTPHCALVSIARSKTPGLQIQVYKVYFISYQYWSKSCASAWESGVCVLTGVCMYTTN